MSTTPRLGLSYPALTGLDPADVPFWMNALAVQLDGMVAPMSHGPLSTRPVSSVGTPGIADRLYWANDVDPDTLTDRANVNGQLYRDNGTGWDPVGPFASKVAMGSFTIPIVTGNFDVTGLGFQPKAIDLQYGPNDDSDTNMAFGQGFATSSTNRGSAWFRATSAGGGTYQRRTRTTRCIFIIDNNGTITAQADLVSMLADGFRLNFITAPAAGNSCQWKAWG
jgi:hypothetical protein